MGTDVSLLPMTTNSFVTDAFVETLHTLVAILFFSMHTPIDTETTLFALGADHAMLTHSSATRVTVLTHQAKVAILAPAMDASFALFLDFLCRGNARREHHFLTHQQRVIVHGQGGVGCDDASFVKIYHGWRSRDLFQDSLRCTGHHSLKRDRTEFLPVFSQFLTLPVHAVVPAPPMHAQTFTPHAFFPAQLTEVTILFLIVFAQHESITLHDIALTRQK